MEQLVRRMAACVLACSLAVPAMANLSVSLDKADPSPCARQSAADDCTNPMLLSSAGDLAELGLSGQPLPHPLLTPAPTRKVTEGAARHIRVTEIAALMSVAPASGAATNSTAPALFWVFGSGLLGAAFIARRRKPARRRSRA